jgi:hypothetical protein
MSPSRPRRSPFQGLLLVPTVPKDASTVDASSLTAMVRIGEWKTLRTFWTDISEAVDISSIAAWFHKFIYTSISSALREAHKDVENGAKECFEIAKVQGAPVSDEVGAPSFVAAELPRNLRPGTKAVSPSIAQCLSNVHFGSNPASLGCTQRVGYIRNCASHG